MPADFNTYLDDLYNGRQVDLAADVGMSKGQINRIATGQVEPSALLMRFLEVRKELRDSQARHHATDRLVDALRELGALPCGQ